MNQNNAINESTNADIRASKAMGPGFMASNFEVEIKHGEDGSDLKVLPTI